jgi:hypothetical protein
MKCLESIHDKKKTLTSHFGDSFQLSTKYHCFEILSATVSKRRHINQCLKPQVISILHVFIYKKAGEKRFSCQRSIGIEEVSRRRSKRERIEARQCEKVGIDCSITCKQCTT